MPSPIEKDHCSFSGTESASGTFACQTDEFEKEARTRENLDELAWKLYARYIEARNEDFAEGLSFTEKVSCRCGLLWATTEPVSYDPDDAVMSERIDHAVRKAVQCARFTSDTVVI